MFHFHFVYSDGSTYDVSHVTKIVIKTPTGTTEIIGDDILTSKIPLGRELYLYMETGNVTLSGTNLVIIDVQKRDN